MAARETLVLFGSLLVATAGGLFAVLGVLRGATTVAIGGAVLLASASAAATVAVSGSV